MNTTDIILHNFAEVRRRSIKVWLGIPPEHYFWKPDEKAMGLLESVRHVLEADNWFHRIIENRGTVQFDSPWKDRPYTNLANELEFAEPFRDEFMDMVRGFSEEEIETVEIYRPELEQRRKLGDYLLRVAYHEAVHTGQLLNMLRTLNIPRPKIWD